MDAAKNLSEQEMLKDQLAVALKQHDWYYFYSDSNSVYHNGEQSKRKIERLVEQLGDEGLVMFNKMAPEQFRR